jgi:hypothetical protein
VRTAVRTVSTEEPWSCGSEDFLGMPQEISEMP